jgi:hypothetical protein
MKLKIIDNPILTSYAEETMDSFYDEVTHVAVENPNSLDLDSISFSELKLIIISGKSYYELPRKVSGDAYISVSYYSYYGHDSHGESSGDLHLPIILELTPENEEDQIFLDSSRKEYYDKIKQENDMETYAYKVCAIEYNKKYGHLIPAFREYPTKNERRRMPKIEEFGGASLFKLLTDNSYYRLYMACQSNTQDKTECIDWKLLDEPFKLKQLWARLIISLR